MTMPLASWLDCYWRFGTRTATRETIAAAARILDAQVWDRHKIKLLYCDDAWAFRTMSTAEVERGRVVWEVDDRDPPQLGTHADPTCRHLTADNFFALIGTKTDRPLPLYTMNTAALYEPLSAGESIADLFLSRRLWSDHPERDCAGCPGYASELPK